MNKKHLTREALLKIIETDQAQCGETYALACIVLAAIDNEISLTRNIVPEEMNIGTAMNFWGGGRGSIHSFVAGYNLCRADMLAAVPQLPGSEPSTVPGKWIPVSEQMPPSRQEVLVGRWWGEKPRWCCKWATYIPGHPDAQSSGWLIPGASWTPTHWMPLPAAPRGVKCGK